MWRTANPVPRLFRPRPSQTVRIERDAQGEPVAVFVFDPVISDLMRENGRPVPAVSATLCTGKQHPYCRCLGSLSRFSP